MFCSYFFSIVFCSGRFMLFLRIRFFYFLRVLFRALNSKKSNLKVAQLDKRAVDILTAVDVISLSNSVIMLLYGMDLLSR